MGDEINKQAILNMYSMGFTVEEIAVLFEYSTREVIKALENDK
ncbi:hypothetical protein ACLM5H_24650 [Fredinandcohnia humi]